jgi:hypothetical protein
MRLALKCHPESPSVAARSLEIEVARPGRGSLVLTYVVTGAIGDLALPPMRMPERTDALWQHTCFEAFIRPPGEGYYEFNFAPSKQWAAYRFDSYRSEMRQASGIAAPRIEVHSTGERFELQASLELPAHSAVGSTAGEWRLALSAVIEDMRGDKSYWALAHPPAKPDFHHPDCFAIALPEAELR